MALQLSSHTPIQRQSIPYRRRAGTIPRSPPSRLPPQSSGGPRVRPYVAPRGQPYRDGLTSLHGRGSHSTSAERGCLATAALLCPGPGFVLAASLRRGRTECPHARNTRRRAKRRSDGIAASPDRSSPRGVPQCRGGDPRLARLYSVSPRPVRNDVGVQLRFHMANFAEGQQ